MTRWIALVIVATTTIVHASPAAEKLFQDGRALMNQGKLAEACDAFRRSNELEVRVGTLLNLANCEEKRGRTATAWSTFIEARALAKRQSDERAAAEADKRAGALAPKLSYLTIKAPKDVAVRRNGTDVPVAELDQDVPLDPGTYVVEASAPGRQPFKLSVDLTAGMHSVVEVPALAATGSATPPPVVAPVEQPALPSALGRRIAIGALIGGSTDKDVIGGLRGVLNITALGPGVVRFVPFALYTRSHDPMDQYHHTDIVALGLGLEYGWDLAPQVVLAAGLAGGVDLNGDNYNGLFTQGFAEARVSPTYRVGRFDVGLHLQLVLSTRVIGLGQLGLDYFF